ncbi:MAG TPA: hypothetical protein VHD61_16600 [Lacunisphaera sp.]|nr:hypothetical protein [Lacunisphaera sp.]
MLSPRRYSTLTLAACVLLGAGCRDREIVSYRAPKDPAPTAMPAAAGMSGQLPDGHPPIGQSTNPGPVNGAQLPEGHPPIGQAAGAGDMGALPQGALPTAEGNALVWTAPADWQAKPNGMIRKGSYNVPGDNGAVADLSITAFPGDTGGLFANVNRWRGQIGLPPIAESALEANIQRQDVGDFHLVIVDATGTNNGQATRLLGAIVPFQGQTWFFKLVGPEPVVARQQAAFRQFLATIKAR